MSYTAAKSITIDHTKVGTADSASFPMAFSGVYSYLATIVNGGVVTNSSGYDIIFTSDAAGLDLLNWEIESYDPTTGTVNFWVNIPTISHTADTKIYIFYGNAAITTFQGGDLGTVWDANYQAVYHFGSSLTADSTSHDITLTNSGTALATTGVINGGASLVTASTQHLHAAVNLSSPSALSFEIWMNSAALSSAVETPIAYYDSVSLYDNRLTTNGGQLYFGGNNAGYSQIHVAAPSNNTWHHIVGVQTGTAGVLYIDGVVAASGTVAAIISGAATTILSLGYDPGDGFYFGGSLDEARLSTVARTASWVTASYNNQSSPSTFYSLASLPSGRHPFTSYVGTDTYRRTDIITNG